MSIQSLAINEVYKEMLANRKQLNEVTSLKNLIHSEVETIRSEFTDAISIDGIEEKINDAEKNDLTPKDKEIIKHLRKVIETIDALVKVEYEGVITTSSANIEGETKKDEEVPAEVPAGDSEEQLKSADAQFKEPTNTDGEDFNFEG